MGWRAISICHCNCVTLLTDLPKPQFPHLHLLTAANTEVHGMLGPLPSVLIFQPPDEAGSMSIPI